MKPSDKRQTEEVTADILDVILLVQIQCTPQSCLKLSVIPGSGVIHYFFACCDLLMVC